MESMLTKNIVIVSAGSFVTCERHHVICEVTEPIHHGTMNWAYCLNHYRVEEPVIGGPVPTCPCGAAWCRTSPTKGWSLFIEGKGWT